MATPILSLSLLEALGITSIPNGIELPSTLSIAFRPPNGTDCFYGLVRSVASTTG